MGARSDRGWYGRVTECRARHFLAATPARSRAASSSPVCATAAGLDELIERMNKPESPGKRKRPRSPPWLSSESEEHLSCNCSRRHGCATILWSARRPGRRPALPANPMTTRLLTARNSRPAVGHLANLGEASRRLYTATGHEIVLLTTELLNNLAASYILRGPPQSSMDLGTERRQRALSRRLPFPGAGRACPRIRRCTSAGCDDDIVPRAQHLFQGLVRVADPPIFPELVNLNRRGSISRPLGP